MKFELLPMPQSQLIISLIVSRSRHKWKCKGRALVHVSDLKAAVQNGHKSIPSIYSKNKVWIQMEGLMLKSCSHSILKCLYSFVQFVESIHVSNCIDTLSFHLSPHQSSEEIKSVAIWVQLIAFVILANSI